MTPAGYAPNAYPAFSYVALYTVNISRSVLSNDDPPFSASRTGTHPRLCYALLKRRRLTTPGTTPSVIRQHPPDIPVL